MTSVLVVDDSRLARMLVAGILERLRPAWKLVEAASAEEATVALQNGRIDIALLDINMPGTDGLTLAERLREQHPDIVIAIISANIQDEVVTRARAMGAAFIPKPLTDEALASALDGAALRMKRAATKGQAG